jgi:phospholipid/cholesterol/gamma-HCH transport system permease protein
MKQNPHVCPYEIIPDQHGCTGIFFHGRLDVETASGIFQSLNAELNSKKPSQLRLDLSDVSYMDDYGAIILYDLKHIFNIADENFKIHSVSDQFNEILSTIGQIVEIKPSSTPASHQTNFIIQLGEKTIISANSLKFFVAFIGSIFLALTRMVKKPKSLRLDDVVWHMKTTGVNALPVVALISGLLGLIMAFMSSLQLKQFGANLYVASLVSLAMVSELGPIMTAIVVAGRSGSAFAAEIGTMKISEEIDALFTMGFDPVLFLVIPRLFAAIIVIPILTIFADIFAIAGGLLIGITMLNLTTGTYIAQTIKTLTLFEFCWGLSKSFVFSILIAGVGCLRGFQAKGGASAVGHAATSAVVTSIFLIILFDSLFAVIRSYWG